MSKYELITVLGPTASGKTRFAVALAQALRAKGLAAEIISADSRQLYRGMDIGTGKDLDEYRISDTEQIPYHLIDICDAGEKYNVFEFQHDFFRVYNDISTRNVLPIMCGGTGMYIESVLRGYKLLAVPENKALRTELASWSMEQLKAKLETYQSLHNSTDLDSVKRAIRAIEIADYSSKFAASYQEFTPPKSLIVGLDIDRELRREIISRRLSERLQQGMLAEVQALLDNGVSPDDLIYYGLEYKFVTQHLVGELSYKQMHQQLEIAIHQFAKRQMTWFRGMERRGFEIMWLDAAGDMAANIDSVVGQWNKKY